MAAHWSGPGSEPSVTKPANHYLQNKKPGAISAPGFFAAKSGPLLERLERQVLELHFHGRACVELQSEDAAGGGLRAFIGHIDGLFAVDEVLEMVAFGDDFVVVPFAVLDGCLDFVGVAHGTRDFDLRLGRALAVINGHLFTTLGEDAAEALLVQNARVSLAGFHVGLVTADHPVFRIEDFRAVLNARVGKAFRAGNDFVLTGELEIGHGAAFPDQKGIALGGRFLGGLADDGTLVHRPKIGAAIPASEVLAIEDDLLAVRSQLGVSEGPRRRKDWFVDDFVFVLSAGGERQGAQAGHGEGEEGWKEFHVWSSMSV